MMWETKVNDSPNGSLDMTETNDIGDSLFDTIQNSDLKSIGIDYGEIALDALTDSELLKQIPVLGTLNKVCGFVGSVSNGLFAKKLLKFLYEFKDISAKERRKMISNVVVNTEERQRIGETLMLILDKLNDMSKPTLLARAFRAFLEEKISLQDFIDLAQSIDLVRVTYLPQLKAACQSGYTPPETKVYSTRSERVSTRTQDIKQHLAVCGLMSMSVASKETRKHGVQKSFTSTGKSTSLTFRPTFLGQLFVEFVMTDS